MDEVRRSIEHLCLHSSTAIAVDMTQPMAEEDRTSDPVECQMLFVIDCSVFHLFKSKLQIMQGHPHSIHLDWRQCQQSQRQAQQSTLFSKIPSFQHIRA
jgi:hypothetical protein